MKRTDFIKCIYKIASLGTHSYFEDYIKRELQNIKVGGFEFNDYLVLYFILIIMSILISVRYSSRLFKDSVMNTYREEA